jgi:spermidine/putrescine transport system permease protein
MMKMRLGRLAGILLVLSTYLFLYIPLIVLTLFSFNKDTFPAPWSGFTMRWYYELWESTYLWEAFSTSLIVALSATFLSVTIGIMLLYAFMQSARAHRVMQLFYVNLVIPEVVLAVGLLSLFSYLRIELGMRTLIVAHTVLGLGYVIPIVYQKFSSIESQLIDASLDLGASSAQTFFRIVLPLLRPSLYAASLLVFVISFDDFVLSYFCSGSSAQTLSLYIESMLRTGISPVVNALSTLLLAGSSALVLLFCYYNARSKIL